MTSRFDGVPLTSQVLRCLKQVRHLRRNKQQLILFDVFRYEIDSFAVICQQVGLNLKKSYDCYPKILIQS